MTPLAHVGHWYHIVLYLVPLLMVAGGLWYAGKRLPDEDELDGFDDEDLDGARDGERPPAR